MTNRESKQGWLAIQPTGKVRFCSTHLGPKARATDETDTSSYLGEHCKLTPVGEELFCCGSNWSQV